MATGNFQLFPPHAQTTDNNTAVESNPFRKKKSQGPSAATFPLQNLMKGSATESVIIHIVEEPKRMEQPASHGPKRAASKKIPKAGPSVSHAGESSKALEPAPKGALPIVPAEQTEIESRPGSSGQLSRPKPPGIKVETGAPTFASANTIIPQNIPPPPPRPSSFYASALETRTDSPSPPTTSPIGRMTSMFPTYDHTLSLNQQHYYPSRQASLPAQRASREEYKPRVVSPTPLDEVLGPKTAPSSVINFPLDDLAIKGPQYSAPRELEKLWEATNGQDPQTVLPGFDLLLSRTDIATFTFGSSPSQPFYTLQTYDTSELAISRTNPRKPTVQIPILIFAVDSEAHYQSPEEPSSQISYIFPRLAEVLAVEQATELAAEHGLAPTHRDEMRAEAVSRAAAQEGCQLLWNESAQRYELLHPAMSQSPDHQPNAPPVLHITVTCPSTPFIQVLAPYGPMSEQALSSPDSNRLSTLPRHPDSPNTAPPLATLDLSTCTLHISARAILSLLPSLYAIDSIIGSILAIAIHHPDTNTFLGDMPLNPLLQQFPRRPSSIHTARGSPNIARSIAPSSRAPSVTGRSYAGSTLYATLAEREEAEEEARLMRQLRSKQAKKSANRRAYTFPFFSARTSAKRSSSRATTLVGGSPVQGKDDIDLEMQNLSISPKTLAKAKRKRARQKKRIVMTEIDLDKVGRYQGGEREGEKLPGVVRGVLKGLVAGLQFVVWLLVSIVRALVWVLVRGTRGVTSEKF